MLNTCIFKILCSMIKQFFKKFIHDIIKYLNKIPIGHLVFWRCTCSCFNVNIKFWLKCVYSNKKRRVALVIKEAHLTSTCTYLQIITIRIHVDLPIKKRKEMYIIYQNPVKHWKAPNPPPPRPLYAFYFYRPQLKKFNRSLLSLRLKKGLLQFKSQT